MQIEIIDLDTLTASEKDDLIRRLVEENNAMRGVMHGVSHGMIRIRATVDPAVSKEKAREMRRQDGDAL